MGSSIGTRGLVGVALLLGAVAVQPAAARAEGLFSGYLGSTFSDDGERGATSYGLSLGATAGGVFGVELDVATTSDIFDRDPRIASSSITTAMGNLLLGLGGPVRPYVTGGVGLIRTSVDGVTATADANELGINVGGGVMVFFTDHIGIRGDLRYFRTVGGDPLDLDVELGDLRFWRGSGGLAVRW